MKSICVAATLLAAAVVVPAAPSQARAAGHEGRCVTLTRGFWIDVFAKRNAEAARKYITAAYIQHSPPPQPKGEEWVAVWKGVFADTPYGPGKDFPESQKDFKTAILSIKGDDHFAVLVAHDTGTYDHGPDKGKTFDSRYTDMFRCSADKVVEHWFSPEI